MTTTLRRNLLIGTSLSAMKPAGGADGSKPATPVLTSKVSPDAALTYTVKAGKVAHTAALGLVYAATTFILIVNHFTHADAKGFMARGKAIDHVRDTIKEQTGVKGNMLDIYIRNASTLAGIFTDNKTLLSPQIAQMAAAETPEQMAGIIQSWFEKHHEEKGLRRKITSLATMSEALGYSVSKRKNTGGGALSKENAVERVTNQMAAVKKIVDAGEMTDTQARQVAQAVVVNAPKPITYAIEALKRLTDEDDLDLLEVKIKERRKELKELAAKAAANQKAAAKAGTGTLTLVAAKQTSKSKSKTQRRAA
jgi:hypothetical protein